MDYLIYDTQLRIEEAKERLADEKSPKERKALTDRIDNFTRLKEILMKAKTQLHNEELEIAM